MEEKILSVAEFSTEMLKERSEQKKTNSFLGALFPLVLPVFVFIYLLSEEKKLSDLEPIFQFFFWASIVFSCVLFLCYDKFRETQNKTISNITEETQKQSLVISNQRIYGNCNGEFSFLYSEIERVYSTQTAGNPTELVLVSKQGELLTFKCVKNESTIISIVSQIISKEKALQEHASLTQAETSRSVDVVAENKEPNECEEESVQSEIKTIENGNNSKAELFDVVILSATNSLKHIKAIRQITLMDLKETTELLSTLPCTLLKNVPLEEANDVMNKLEKSGIQVALSPSAT